MNLFAKILAGVLASLPAFINLAQARNNTSGDGPSRLQDVLSGIQAASAVAGVVDPAEQAIITGLSTVAVNGIVAVNNAVAKGTVPASTASAAGILVPSIAAPSAPAPAPTAPGAPVPVGQ